MCNMLFVNGSHPLSPYIYSLNSQFDHLSDKECSNIKEKIDPSARSVKLIFIILKQCYYFTAECLGSLKISWHNRTTSVLLFPF
jgi:hypothetical protein